MSAPLQRTLWPDDNEESEGRSADVPGWWAEVEPIKTAGEGAWYHWIWRVFARPGNEVDTSLGAGFERSRDRAQAAAEAFIEAHPEATS